MARQITKKRGKSPIQVRLEKEREASRRDPKGKKSVVSKAAIASLAIPGSAAVKAGAKAAKAVKAVKAVKKKAVKKVAKKTREFNKNLAESNKLVKAEKSGYPLKNIKASAKDKSVRSLTKNMKEFKKNYGADNLKRAISGVDKPKKVVKKSSKSQKNLVKDTRQYAADRRLEKAVTNKKPFTTTSRPSTKDNFKKDGSLRIDNASKRGMKKGGIVKSHRGDGIAKRGRTRGRII